MKATYSQVLYGQLFNKKFEKIIATKYCVGIAHHMIGLRPNGPEGLAGMGSGPTSPTNPIKRFAEAHDTHATWRHTPRS